MVLGVEKTESAVPRRSNGQGRMTGQLTRKEEGVLGFWWTCRVWGIHIR